MPGKPSTYLTVTQRGRAEFDVKQSTFVCYAAPAQTVTEAETIIAGITDNYPDATHHVPAYRLRETEHGGFTRDWASDDGEPSGSAGKPMLNVLQQQSIENVVVVVVRYFGGTKLGIGGLTRAYAAGAKRALNAAGINEVQPRVTIRLMVAYAYSDAIRRVFEQHAVSFDATYRERVAFDAIVETTAVDEVCDRIRRITSGDVDIEITDLH